MDYLKKFFKYTKDDSLIRDSFILFIATMITNLGAFLYHFFMGRFLGPADYGILGVSLSLFYILLVPFYLIQTSLSKFVSNYRAKKQNKKISYLFLFSLKKLFLFSILVFFISLILSFIINDFFNVSSSVLLIVSLSIPFLFLLPITRGFLQGLQNFKHLGLNMISESFSKFLFGFILVFLGYGVFGAIFGIVISYILAFILGLFSLKKYFKNKKVKLNTKEIYKYSIPVFIVLLTLTLFYSIDVMLVKHYFDDITAGYYTAFALLGRIVFFASFSIVFVLFPKVAEMHALGKPNLHILKKSLLLITFVSLGIILSYLIFPKLIILILFGQNYLPIIPYMVPFALIMSLFSYVYILSFYNLSIHKVSFVYYLFLLNIFEVFLFIKFHSSLWHIIFSLLVLISITLIFMLIYTFKNGKIVNSNSRI